eukprot:gene4240-1745_t
MPIVFSLAGAVVLPTALIKPIPSAEYMAAAGTLLLVLAVGYVVLDVVRLRRGAIAASRIRRAKRHNPQRLGGGASDGSGASDAAPLPAGDL